MNSFIILDALKLLDKYKFDYTFKGNQEVVINKAYAFDNLSPHGLAFFRNNDIDKYTHLFNESTLVLVNNSLKRTVQYGNFIFSDNPSLCFNIIGWLLKNRPLAFIHPTAIIDETAKIGNGVHIGANTYITGDVVIEDNCIVQDNCTIKNATIGESVLIQSGARIGNRGLGSQIFKSNGLYFDFPHFGRVIIGKNVVVQDGVIINRGTLNDTFIGDNTRIGPLSWIAHGVNLGVSCLIAQGVTIAGSVSIGNNTIIWSNASIRDGLKIGNNCTVGMGSVVTKNIPDEETWVGNPARRKLF